ncbi:hypothetical protein MLD38_039261 [Melastoma candidum]|uniref:Uncharacterized protein n=1 Tax=Melastoma candidum TaxID=119954 RepID=A0ACB9L2X3_9MYRT|nr:hypothetical protein MLD38_039261 [Melastoma candidum]
MWAFTNGKKKIVTQVLNLSMTLCEVLTAPMYLEPKYPVVSTTARNRTPISAAKIMAKVIIKAILCFLSLSTINWFHHNYNIGHCVATIVARHLLLVILFLITTPFSQLLFCHGCLKII